MSSKHITLYSHRNPPNGWKVAYVLELLGLTYETKFLDFNHEGGENKKPEFLKLNPNGRIPVIIDHKNGDFVLWESNAIIEYLVDTYDPEHKISATGNDKYVQKQWLYFQASGQGPYYGQASWFHNYHAEKIPSAIERYTKEILRVLGVLESVLSKQEWLVGGKMTVADVSLFPYNTFAPALVAYNENLDFDFEKDFPATYAWHQKILNHPTIQKVLADKEAAKQ